ncbi:MAG TPA: lipid II flippase MurJ [Micromonosporaceae bacterium]|nr:lipid II flippase MurJ [Micromonosporaceae bacterium]
MLSRGTAGRIAGAAALIAVLTVASRLAGFGRLLVFNWAVGADDLGDVYQLANFLPNVIFEVVAGGAIASLVVPLLVQPAARGDRGAVADAVSALLTWVLALLVPVAVGVALAAGPLVRLIAPGASPAAVEVGTDMLRVFAPQLPLYGVGIVLAGVLQTYRRFAWPVIAPLLSSATVVLAYAGFALVTGRASQIGQVSRGEVLILSAGTTAAVAVLSLSMLIPLRGSGLRPRLRWRFAAAGTVRRLALAGTVTVGAQQLAVALALALAYGGPTGSVVLYTLAQTIFLLPWAVLALPVATSAYPALAEAGADGDEDAYRRTLAPAVRALVLLCFLGVAALVTLAAPLAQILSAMTNGHPPPWVLAAGIAGFAPGLLGYGLFALLSRALYARGAAGTAALATALGWAGVAGCSVALAAALPAGQRVVALTLANAVGMSVLGIALLLAVARRAGRSALAGAGRAMLVGLVAATVATAAGIGVRWLGWHTSPDWTWGFTPGAQTPGMADAVVSGMLCGGVVGVVYLAVAAALDRRDVRPMLAGAARRLPGRRGEARGGSADDRDDDQPGPAGDGPGGERGGPRPAQRRETVR